MNGNDPVQLQAAMETRALRWRGPLTVLACRPIAALAVSLAAAGIAALGGASDPFVAAAPWFVVYGTVIDVICLGVIAKMARAEGLRLRDLFGPRKGRGFRDVLLGLALFVGAAPIAFGMIAMTGIAIYGEMVEFPYVGLPLWAGIYAMLFWPLLWGLTEQLTYHGYALPRVEALTSRTWLAWLIVAGVLSLQHFALPFVPDLEFLAWRTLQFVPLALIVGAVYLKLRRIHPLVVAHILLDVTAGASIGLLPTITG